MNKKRIRAKFRQEVFDRDGYQCRKCGFKSSPAKAENEIDAHHIINRNNLPFGGYIRENGITLCRKCHLEAEQGNLGFDEQTLFACVKSSREEAIEADLALGKIV